MPVSIITKNDTSFSMEGVGYFGIIRSDQPVTMLPSGETTTVSGEFTVLRSQLNRQYSCGPLRASDYGEVVEEVDFAYGKRLDASVDEDPNNGFGSILGGIIDHLPSGELEENAILRILTDGANVTASGENQKTIYAADLSTDIIPSGAGIILVDPVRGRISAVECVFFEQGTTLDMSTPVVCPVGTVSRSAAGVIGGGVGTLNGGSAIYAVGGWSGDNATNEYGYYTWTMPFNFTESGTASFWALGSHEESYNYVDAWVGSYIVVSAPGIIDAGLEYNTSTFTPGAQLAVNGSVVGNVAVGLGTANHLYLIWDTKGRITNGRTAQLYLNGSLAVETSSPFNHTALPFKIRICVCGCYESAKGWRRTWAYLTHLMAFKGIVSESPTWAYNGGVLLASPPAAYTEVAYRRVRDANTRGIIRI